MSDLRLFLLEPDVVFQAQINQASFDYPIDEVSFDNVTTGAYTDIRTGMTVLFGDTAGGDNLGRQRVRKLPTSDTLYIGRSSQGRHDGEVELADGRWITVIDDYRVWAKVPYIADDGTVSKDADVTFQPESPPVSNVGAAMAGMIDSGTGKLQVTLPHESNTSFATHDGASVSTYAWELPTGVTLDSGTINDSQITVNCDPGFYWIACTVTDSNGNAHGAHVPVLAIDPDDDPTVAFQVESHAKRPAGQEVSVRILEDIAESTYPDGTLVMMWEGEPSGPTDRSHMEFIGWHQTDEEGTTAERTGTLKDTVLNCIDVAGRLRSLPGFPQTVAANDSPSSWLQMANPNMDKYMHYLLYWHSTALEVGDWTWSGTGSAFEFVVLSSDGESLWDQVNRRAEAMTPDYKLTCNRLGQMAVTVDPMVQDSADRTATVQTTISENEWRDVRHSGQRPPRIHWHRRGAILASNTEISAVFCVAPGESPGQGLDANEQDEKLTPDQDTLNATEGHRYARMNAPQGYFNVTLVGSDDYDIEPADLTWVQLDIPAAYAARRGLNFTNEQGLVREMNISYEHNRTGLTKTIELLWERETSGTPAVTYTIPANEVIEWPDDPPDPGPDPQPGGNGFGALLVMTEDTLGLTTDLSASSPSYSDITPGAATTLYDFVLDPWNPSTRGWAATDAGVYEVTNYKTSPSWSLYYSNATGVPLNLRASINVENWLAVWQQTLPNGTGIVAVTDNDGSSWTEVTIGSDLSAFCGFDISKRSTTHVLHLLDAFNEDRYFRSDNDGTSWSLIDTYGISTYQDMIAVHVPYPDNTNGLTCYFGSQNQGIIKTTDGGASLSVFNGSVVESNLRRGGLEVFTEDADRVTYWENDGTGVMHVTTDGGSSWSQPALNGLSGTVTGAGGFPTKASQYYAVTTSGIFVSVDGGQNWQNKTGNWAFGFTFNDDPYRGVVVPDWTE